MVQTLQRLWVKLLYPELRLRPAGRCDHCYQSQWHRNCFICRQWRWGPHQATIFSKGHALSWLTNLLWSTFSSLHCLTWLSVAEPRRSCLFPLLDKVTPSLPYFCRWFQRSRTTSARNGLLAPRSYPSSDIYCCLPGPKCGAHADRSTWNVTNAHANRFRSMETYWTWKWTTDA